jgi:hypothetical protein
VKESDPTWGVTLEKQLQGFEECRIEFLNKTRGYVYLQNQIIVDSLETEVGDWTHGFDLSYYQQCPIRPILAQNCPTKTGIIGCSYRTNV